MTFRASQHPVPEASSIGVRLILEVVGLAIGVVAYRRYGLDEPDKRNRLIRTGHLTTSWT
jgi:hypothetical protein